MIIDYDHNPRLTVDQKLQSLKESVQMALNEAGSDKEYLDKTGLEYFWSKLKAAFAKKEDAGVVIVEKSPLSSLPTTITDSRITEDHVCIKAELSNPALQQGRWTITTSAGTATISGSIKTQITKVTLYFAKETS